MNNYVECIFGDFHVKNVDGKTKIITRYPEIAQMIVDALKLEDKVDKMTSELLEKYGQGHGVYADINKGIIHVHKFVGEGKESKVEEVKIERG